MKKFALLSTLLFVLGCKDKCDTCCLPNASGHGTATCTSATADPDSSQNCENSPDCADCKGCTGLRSSDVPAEDLATIAFALLPESPIAQLEHNEPLTTFNFGKMTIQGMSPWDSELMLTDYVREWTESHGRTVLKVTTPMGVTYIKGRFIVDRQHKVIHVLSIGLAAVTYEGMSSADQIRFANAKAIYQKLER